MIETKFDGLAEIQEAIARISQLQPREIYVKFWKTRRQGVLRDRFRVISKQTPYAPSSLGTRKPKSGVRRGSPKDPGYSIDSGELMRDLLERPDIQEYSLTIFSDRPYAQYQERLWEQKGPYSPDGLFNDAILDSEGKALEEAIDEAMDEIFGW